MAVMIHEIWSNESLNVDDWEFDESLTEEERVSQMYELNDDALFDARCDLEVPLDRKVVVLGELGLWDGRRIACRFAAVKTVGELLDCSMYDGVTWMVDDVGDLCRRGVHHDGVNVEVFRLLKQDVSEDDVALTVAVCSVSGYQATREAVTEMTESLGKIVSEVYGWSDEQGD